MFRNHTLAALQESDRTALVPHLVRIHVERGAVLTDQGAEIDQIYFPTTAYLLNAVTFSDGRSAQTFVMGIEGVSGLAAFLAEIPSAWGVEVRSSGEVYRLPAPVLRRQVERSPNLRRQLLRLTHDYQAQAAYAVGCGSLHSAVARLANFILTSADRLGDDRLHLTQQDVAEFLSIQHHGQQRRQRTQGRRSHRLQPRGDPHHRPARPDPPHLRVLRTAELQPPAPGGVSRAQCGRDGPGGLVFIRLSTTRTSRCAAGQARASSCRVNRPVISR